MIESKHTDSEYTDLYKRYGLDFINSQDLSIPLADIIFNLEEQITLLSAANACYAAACEDAIAGLYDSLHGGDDEYTRLSIPYTRSILDKLEAVIKNKISKKGVAV